MSQSKPKWRSSLRIPLDMGLATIGLTVLFLPAISMTNELLGLPISRSAVTEGVVLLSLLISPLYSGGYLSSNRLWNTTLVFVSSTIGLLLVGVVVVYLFGAAVNSLLPTAVVLLLAYATTFYAIIETTKNSA